MAIKTTSLARALPFKAWVGPAGGVGLVLPVPPTTNNLYATTREGKRVKSKTARAYAILVEQIVNGGRVLLFEGDVGIRIWVYRPRKVGDIDNYKKALYDSLKGKCWRDDKQIVYEEAFRHDDKNNPRVEVEIWEVKP